MTILHPLCVATICDQYVRLSKGGSKLTASTMVFGLLFGVGNSIFDAVEATVEVPLGGGEVQLNLSEIEKLRRLNKAVFPDYEILGWYTVGSEVTTKCHAIHSAMFKVCSHPLFLMLHLSPETMISSSSSNNASGNIAVDVLVAQFVTEEEFIFVEQKYALGSNLAENMSLEQVAKDVNAATGAVGPTEQYYAAASISLRTLDEKLNVIVRALSAMASGEIPLDYDLLRKAKGLVNDAHVISAYVERNARAKQQEAAALRKLTAVTSAYNDLNRLISIFMTVHGDNMGMDRF